MEKIPDHRTLPTFSEGDARHLGGFVWADEAAVERATGRRLAAAAGPVRGARGLRAAEQPAPAYRNGYYERDFVTRLGTTRLRIARTRGKSFLPRGLERFQRRAEDVDSDPGGVLAGLSTRPAGRVLATLTGKVVSAPTVSKLTRDLEWKNRTLNLFTEAA